MHKITYTFDKFINDKYLELRVDIVYFHSCILFVKQMFIFLGPKYQSQNFSNLKSKTYLEVTTTKKYAEIKNVKIIKIRSPLKIGGFSEYFWHKKPCQNKNHLFDYAIKDKYYAIWRKQGPLFHNKLLL